MGLFEKGSSMRQTWWGRCSNDSESATAEEPHPKEEKKRGHLQGKKNVNWVTKQHVKKSGKQKRKELA